MSATHRLLRFGLFELNLDTEELRKDGIALKLGPQPVKVLAILAGRSGQIVTREEIRQEVWGDETYVDFEHGLNQCIKQIRTALNDNSSKPLYIETLPRKGYRFLAPVTSKTVAVTPKVTASSSGIQPRAVLPAAIVADGSASPTPAANVLTHPGAETEHSFLNDDTGVAVIAERTAPPPSKRSRVDRRIGWLALPVLAAIGIAFYWHSQKASALTDTDTVVLADFVNNTVDPVFDDTLKTALAEALKQSPFLDLLQNSKVAATLKLMTLPTDAKLTPDVAREICLRTDSAAYVTGSIDRLGTQYVLQLKAVNCHDGDALAQEQVTAESKEKVLNALGAAATKLRRQLGESLATVQKFDTPLAQATTSSLDALKAYSLAGKASAEKGPSAGIPYAQRAIQLDPNFAMAHYLLGGFYFNISERDRAQEYFTKAYELREHASEREKLIISGAYYYQKNGQLEKAAQIYQETIDDYPRDRIAYQNLSLIFSALGLYEKAADAGREALRLTPNGVGQRDNLVNYLLALGQFQQAREIIQETEKLHLDDSFTHAALYALAFLHTDSPGMTAQQQWFASNEAVAHFGLSLEADTKAYTGQSTGARDLTEKAVDSALRVENAEEAAMWWENQALREAAFGNLAAAQKSVAAGLKLAPTSLGVQLEAGLAYAIAGNTAQAESTIQSLSQNYPLDTQIQMLWVPAIGAQRAMNMRNPTEALHQLRRVVPPIEFGSSDAVMSSVQISCLYPTYVRGQAYLQSGQGTQAAAEFQKILNHSGLVWNCWTGALAHLGVARANFLESKSLQGSEADAARKRASDEYQHFLTLWKDADPDIPIYKQAKAEYAQLAGTTN